MHFWVYLVFFLKYDFNIKTLKSGFSHDNSYVTAGNWALVMQSAAREV